MWREQVKRIDHVGAAIIFARNLVTEDGRVEPVRGAEISANSFAMLGATPLLGRALTAQDEQKGEPPVVVLSNALWKSRFDSDPGVVGRTVKVGTSSATIVGVMPAGFGFPVNERLWMPLRENGATMAPRSGPTVSIWGRLAPGSSLEQAQAELDVIGLRMAASEKATHEHLRPRVTRYAEPLVGGGQALIIRNVLYAVNGVFLLLLAIVCTNVATLVYWIDASLSWRTTLYAAVLTLIGAAIIGILPALRVTKVNVQDALRSEGAARSGLKFGGFWTAVIVLQVAITVAFMPLAGGGVFESNRFRQRAEGIDAGHYLTAQVAIDREYYGTDSATLASRARSEYEELERRLLAEAGVERVAFADRLPVQDQFKYSIEVDSPTGVPADLTRRSTLVQVSHGFFDAFGTSVISGRDFTPADFENSRAIIVNESFVKYV